MMTTSSRSADELSLQDFSKPTNLHVDVDTAQAQVDPKAWYRRVGKFIALVFGIGTGVTASAALATVFSGPLFIVMATILCTGSVYANYRMTHKDVTDILFGGVKGLFKKNKPEGVADADWHEYISTPKKIALGVGTFLALTFGITFMGLVFKASLDLVLTYTFLSSVAFALPAVGVVLGGVAFIALSAILIGGCAAILKIEKFKEKAIALLTEIFWYVKDRDENKSTLRIVTERMLVGLAVTSVVALTLGLVFFGKINTLQNCARGLHEILLHVPHITASTANIASLVIGRGLALVAQIPFALRLVLEPVAIIFDPLERKEARARRNEGVSAAPKPSAGIQWSTVTLFIASTLSALAQAFIAMQGKVMSEMTVLAGLGSFMDGFVATTSNALLGGRDSKESVPADRPCRGSTVEIGGMIGGNASSSGPSQPDVQPFVPAQSFQQPVVYSASANEERYESGLRGNSFRA
jgi:hypothetical protein